MHACHAVVLGMWFDPAVNGFKYLFLLTVLVLKPR